MDLEVLYLFLPEHLARLPVHHDGHDVAVDQTVDFDVDALLEPLGGGMDRGALGLHLGDGRRRRQRHLALVERAGKVLAVRKTFPAVRVGR